MIFVDPSGDDSGPGTFERPFATLERARDAAAPGTIVHLRAGTYRLADTFRMSPQHSGVVYQAYGYGTADQEEVVISGGRPVDGWHADTGGTWQAPTPGAAPRQLYASGRRVERAAVNVESHGLVRTADGYTAEGAAPQSWSGDVELVYRGAYPWTEARCPVADTSANGDSTAIAMAQPAFDRAVRAYHAVMPGNGPDSGEFYGADAPTSAENSPAFLTDCTFATAGGTLHYRPRNGEEPAGVVAPVLETLLHARGVHDIAFRGITFAEATWHRPSGPGGFLHYHGNAFHDGGELMTVALGEEPHQGQVTVPAEAESIPGNVLIEDSTRVVIEGCRFTRLGGVALEFRGQGSDNAVRHSEITDAAAGGLVIGAGARGHRVEDNHIHGIGRDYRGSPAVVVSGAVDTVIARNRVNDVPHVGITANAGRGTQVLDNLVHDTMQVLADGGGIYISGPQGDSYASGALVRGNVVRDTVTPYNFGLYTDYGAAWVTVQGNAVYRADAPIVLNVWPPLEHVAFIGNVFDADPGEAPPGVTLADNTVLPKEAIEDAPQVADILATCGPRPARQR
ncbi:hypothetical protein HNR23_001735 [Nocardiopsis mwathae]|uniref:Right handed beta helix domain-containing protein n=1 Tax=Nocardiopsis mwathae TaxID=1472723 RepID=A0A7W9YGS5_9ACTN|nr:right-handed parallel beta-helix repeat-containing protein [Nocardiopsis mwathae]MBB6171675.1 hypothetical protein [Nocardiopsis mwathae]